MTNRIVRSVRRVISRLQASGLAVALGCLALAPAVLTGCGSTTKVQQSHSVGQQLQDLDKSYKDGVITQKEYERLKRRIIRDND